MSVLGYAILIALLSWIIWRLHRLSSTRLIAQLNRIEAHLRALPVAEVEVEWAAWEKEESKRRRRSSILSWPNREVHKS